MRGEDSALADRAEHRLRDALDQLERDVAGEAVGDDDVGRAGGDLGALDVADEVHRGRAGRGAQRSSWASSRSSVPLVGSSPLDSSADARALDAEHGARERGAHEGELHEVLGPGLDVGADVEQQDRRAGDRHRQRERRAVDARARLMLNRPAASAAPVEPPDTSASARPSATARAACTIEASGVERTARAGSGALAIETGASTTVTPSGRPPDLGGRAEQQHARAALGGDRGTGRRPRRAPGRRRSRRRRR